MTDAHTRIIIENLRKRVEYTANRLKWLRRYQQRDRREIHIAEIDAGLALGRLAEVRDR